MNISEFDRNVMPVPWSGCWLWTGAISRGYGSLRINNKTESAHRISYRENVGEIKDGLHVLHRCDVRSCVNPKHLFLGTNAENIADSVNKGRRIGITRNRPSGLTYRPMSNDGRIAHMKVKPLERDIVIERLRNGETQRNIAKDLSVSQATVSRILNA